MMGTVNKYKKGDWVRVVHTDYEEEFPLDSIFRVGVAYDHGVDPEGENHELFFCNREIEPWRPKVGERVRVAKHVNSLGDKIRFDLPIGSEHTVTRVGNALGDKARPSFSLSGSDVHFYLVENLEPVIDAPVAEQPAAEAPAALTIQAGRYYKTRDGRKVGPVEPRGYFFSAEGWHYNEQGECGMEGVHKPDEDWRDRRDLIAEWVDTPVTQPVRDITAATVDAINDEYGPMVREVPVAAQQARLKVGDRVKAKKSMMDVTAGQTYEVVEVDPEDEAAPVRIVDDAGDLWWLTVRDFEIVKSATPAIVCKIDNGQPLPATRPVVHSTVEAADAEAKRLANLHTGQEFCVYALTGTPHRVARVYDHEWQRLAAAGEKIQAIKALRNMAALDLVTAKRAVEVFIDKAA